MRRSMGAPSKVLSKGNISVWLCRLSGARDTALTGYTVPALTELHRMQDGHITTIHPKYFLMRKTMALSLILA